MKIDRVLLNTEFSKKEEVLSFISSQMEELGVVERKEDFLEALHEREAQGTTGLTDGFAIPHGKAVKVKSAAVVYVRNTNEIQWETLDGSQVKDIFALAIPQDGSDEHLDNLIAISTSLMDEEVCARLREAESEEEVKAIFG